jgi:hypothetical protein
MLFRQIVRTYLGENVEVLGTIQNLFLPRVITDINNILCVLGENLVESVDHLFFTWEVSSTVWYSIFRWLGF